MQLFDRKSFLHPLYTLVCAGIGGGIAAGLFQMGYAAPRMPDNADTVVPEFWVWLFLLACFLTVLTIFLLPMWAALFNLLEKQAVQLEHASSLSTLLYFGFAAIIILVIVLGSLQWVGSVNTGEFSRSLPANHSQRMNMVYLYAFAVILPLALNIVGVYRYTHQLFLKIHPDLNEKQLFLLAQELLEYRKLLQNLLLIAGIIFSLIPIITAGLRAAVIASKPTIAGEFPVTLVMAYGLLFTILLLLLYVPTHLALTETSKALRDQLCPIDKISLSEIEIILKQRKHLDELLQTNLGLEQNLKTGIVTLAPLATSLVLSILKIDIFG